MNTTNTIKSLTARIDSACDAEKLETALHTPAYLIATLVERESADYETGVALLAKRFLDSYESTAYGAFGSARLTSTDEVEYVLEDGIHLSPETLLSLRETDEDFGFLEMLLDDKRVATELALEQAGG